jgi:hypothetical protein
MSSTPTITNSLGTRIAEPLPPVVCAPWCSDGDGHPDRTIPDDDLCASDRVDVKLSGYMLVKVGAGDGTTEVVRDWVDAQSFRDHYDGPGRVHLGHEAGSRALPSFDLVLTKDEALAVAEELTRAAERLDA